MSVSVAFEGGRSGNLLARAGANRASSEPWVLDVGNQLILGGMGDVMPEGLGKELVGGGQVLIAVAEQHTGPSVEGSPGRFGHEGGLAQAGLARDEHHLAPFGPATRLAASAITCRLGFPPDHTNRGTPGQAGGNGIDGLASVDHSEGLPQHLDGLDRFGQSLQGQFTERAALVSAAPTGHGPHDVGSQDLPAVAGGTQPSCLDDRVPEVVVVLPADLARAQTHPQAHRMLSLPVVPLDALLHRHGTAQRGRGRAEHHHEPVAEVLHLGATGLRHGLAEDREVSPADLVCDLGR